MARSNESVETGDLGNGLWDRLDSSYDATNALWDIDKKRFHKAERTRWHVKRDIVGLTVERSLPRGLLTSLGISKPTMIASIHEYYPNTQIMCASRGNYRLDLIGHQLVHVTGNYFEAPDVFEGGSLKPRDWQLVDSMDVNPERLLVRIAKALDYVIPVSDRAH